MANPWVAFNDLMSNGNKIICRVVSTNSAIKKILVEPVGETSQTYVEMNGGTYANDSYVYVQNGAIVGQAPNVRTIVPELLS